MRILLIFLGAIGIGITSPVAYFGWSMHKGFGGILTGTDTLILIAPFCFLTILIAGFLIPRRKKEKRS